MQAEAKIAEDLRETLTRAGEICSSLAGIAAAESARAKEFASRLAAETARADAAEEALAKIAETARWYAENDQRLAQEVDHALCVEVLSLAEATR